MTLPCVFAIQINNMVIVITIASLLFPKVKLDSWHQRVPGWSEGNEPMAATVIAI